MQQFITGFIIALAVFIPVIMLLLWIKTSSKNESQYTAQQIENEPLAQLEQLSKLTGELAHEIKNPLSTIKINLKLVGEELEVSEQTPSTDQGMKRALRKIAVIQKETDRLEQILDGFLRYIDRTELQLANVDINELVSDMTDFYSSQAHSRSITIRQGPYKNPLICKVDSGMLKQVLSLLRD